MLRQRYFITFSILLAACGPDAHSPADGGAEDDADVNEASAYQCPAVEPVDHAACDGRGHDCLYGTENGVPANRCDCVEPQGKWKCCSIDEVTCSRTPPTDGDTCCAGDVSSYVSYTSCDYCAPDNTAVKCTCAGNDRHWRCTTGTCEYPKFDGGTEGEGGSDAGRLDAGAEVTDASRDSARDG